jgi:hypothetical protein
LDYTGMRLLGPATRSNKPILVADWHRLFFTLGACQAGLIPGQNWDIRAHLLADDDKTVLDTFAFSWFTMSKDNLRRHWEFLRRYMSEGPQAVVEAVHVCLPIADRRESLAFAVRRLHANFKDDAGLWILLLPLWLGSALGRWIGGLTCRIPQWPADIEAACRIEPGDSCVRDSQTNPDVLLTRASAR